MSTKKPSQLQDERTSLVPSVAPPPYTDTDDQQASSSSLAQGQPHPFSAPSSHVPRPARQHPSGPTAFHALPPSSSTQVYQHSLALRRADRRARRRVCAAICWVFVIYVVVGMLVGAILSEEIARGAGEGGRWTEGRVGPWLNGRRVGIRQEQVASILPPDDSFAAI